MAKKKKLITTISDPLLEPYYIQKDEMCYTVVERITPDKDHFRSKGGGTEYAKPQGYYPNFDQALEKVSREKLHTKKDYNTLKEFLNEYKLIENKIKSYTDGIRSVI
tara:strand:- start:675 stop:995 length:321 start_codon:yes stop_codon:yes gene_type:complete